MPESEKTDVKQDATDSVYKSFCDRIQVYPPKGNRRPRHRANETDEEMTARTKLQRQEDGNNFRRRLLAPSIHGPPESWDLVKASTNYSSSSYGADRKAAIKTDMTPVYTKLNLDPHDTHSKLVATAQSWQEAGDQFLLKMYRDIGVKNGLTDHDAGTFATAMSGVVIPREEVNSLNTHCRRSGFYDRKSEVSVAKSTLAPKDKELLDSVACTLNDTLSNLRVDAYGADRQKKKEFDEKFGRPSAHE